MVQQGDGIIDMVDVVATARRDEDGDGVFEVVDQWEAQGTDEDGDGEISQDEIVIDHVSEHTRPDA